MIVIRHPSFSKKKQTEQNRTEPNRRVDLDAPNRRRAVARRRSIDAFASASRDDRPARLLARRDRGVAPNANATLRVPSGRPLGSPRRNVASAQSRARMTSVYRALAFAATGYRSYLADALERLNLPPAPDRDLSGAECVVTGANQGIGFEVAGALVERGARVHCVCRDEARGKAAVDALNARAREAGRGRGRAELHCCDLSSLAQTRRFVERYTASGRALHALVCNAGAMVHERGNTSEGFERNFAVNTLGTHVLVAGLRPVLGRTSQGDANLEGEGGYYAPRVVVVSSAGMLTEPLEVRDLEMRRTKKFDGVKQYARGKRHQTAMMERWARLELENVGEERVKSGKGCVGYYSMHPGWVATTGVANALPKFYASMEGKLRTPAQGADTILYLLTARAEDLQPGAFYFDRAPVAKHITGGFTRYEPKQVDALVSKLDALQAEGSVRSEKNLLKASGSFTKGSATKDASPSSETKTKSSRPTWNIR